MDLDEKNFVRISANRDLKLTRSFAFTETSPKGLLLEQLSTQCGITPKKSGLDPVECRAIWDTGSTNTAVSLRVVEAHGFEISDYETSQTGFGEMETGRIDATILLPNGVAVDDLRVTVLPIKEHADVLIGMDIISLGDFTVSSKGGVTQFSFIMPPLKHVDYRKTAKRENEKREKKQRRKRR